MRKYLLLTGITLLTLFSFLTTVYAQTSLYYNPTDGSILPGNYNLGDTVTVTATTNDVTVKKIGFKWINSLGTVMNNDANVNPTGTTELTASSSYKPTTAGTWTVEVFFQGPDNTLQIRNRVTFTIGIPSAVPEVPLLGTVGIAVAMTLSLMYAVKKKIFI